MDMMIVGIDLGENSCSLAGLDTAGRVVLRRRMRRDLLEKFVSRLGCCIVAMEACCGAHHLGRIFAARGHEVRLMLDVLLQGAEKTFANAEQLFFEAKLLGPVIN